ncbi:MAG: DNA repair protein RadC [Verrucomicrobia bacterium]|nr:DNA repair protein RadC [Verrucomicrobiota bacterium]
MQLKAIPREQRPRERLVQEGIEALSLIELIAIVLSNGTKGKSVLELSQELVTRFGGLDRLLEATVPELREVKGIGHAKAIQLKAVFGIALKCRKSQVPVRQPIGSAQEAFELAREEIGFAAQEMLLVMLRDIRGRLLHLERVSVGTLTELLIHPREVFYPAIRHKAHSMIIAHNHPSGDPTPSQSDLKLTRALLTASEVLSIGLDDHLIVCPDRYLSLREWGFFKKGAIY